MLPAPQSGQAKRLRHKKTTRSMHLHRRLEAVAAADRGDLQVQRRMTRVAAVFDQVVWGLALRADLDELLVLVVGLAEMGTQATLSVVNGHEHRVLLSSPGERTKQFP